MKKKKSLRTLLIAALAVVMMLCVVVAAACASKEEQPSEGPETGVYYNDRGDSEYLLSLFNGDRFTLYIEDKTEFGTYKLEGEALSLQISEENSLSAKLSDNVITMEYNSVEIRFLKKIPYTVNFESNGGSAVEAKTVTNGKTLAKPADPARDGHKFVGWYLDSELKTPYLFNEAVLGDTTLYAKWAAYSVGKSEYTVSFDLGYGDANPEQVKTIGGKLYNLPAEPTREGYAFKGWWISMAEDGEKLSYQYTEDTTFEENTTLFALWQSTNAGGKLDTPLVRVSENSITWDGMTGVSGYSVEVSKDTDEENPEIVYNNANVSTTVISAVKF
ncbi:MAG: InlB B-repeat-containing protein, partial [Clostridiales bacterium]|nr:InlB B-repeat-containing protein [Clostridiales bacterium]